GEARAARKRRFGGGPRGCEHPRPPAALHCSVVQHPNPGSTTTATAARVATAANNSTNGSSKGRLFIAAPRRDEVARFSGSSYTASDEKRLSVGGIRQEGPRDKLQKGFATIRRRPPARGTRPDGGPITAPCCSS